MTDNTIEFPSGNQSERRKTASELTVAAVTVKRMVVLEKNYQQLQSAYTEAIRAYVSFAMDELEKWGYLSGVDNPSGVISWRFELIGDIIFTIDQNGNFTRSDPERGTFTVVLEDSSLDDLQELYDALCTWEVIT